MTRLDATPNTAAWKLWAKVYDRRLGTAFDEARRQAMAMLALQPGERLLLPGVGTGLDLPLLPAGVNAWGIDYSAEMLVRARPRAAARGAQLQVMDAAALAFADASFDAVLFSLALSAVPDARAAFKEGWRVLRSGGRLVILDVFAPNDSKTSIARRALNHLYRHLGGDHLRRLSDVVEEQGSDIDCLYAGELAGGDRRLLLGGQYTVVRLNKGPQPARVCSQRL